MEGVVDDGGFESDFAQSFAGQASDPCATQPLAAWWAAQDSNL